jgi:hypothetical protein
MYTGAAPAARASAQFANGRPFDAIAGALVSGCPVETLAGQNTTTETPSATPIIAGATKVRICLFKRWRRRSWRITHQAMQEPMPINA